ncbi:ribosomal protein S9/S16-domain-containing protein [Dunaliella salina]|uniref:Small ribosomal subunit protein uS9c n=1 Tax=Dunaliella salina TaxID=3046 RepID=A0ABQ7FY32_DUNSA|nr:ribosomal protein S9/S16-domain-containing protein [Dunaliella salina]|eukprot:KAF5827270.1 ribosomal protein S9/S16-domain-containing protein [Dunaliella salina]
MLSTSTLSRRLCALLSQHHLHIRLCTGGTSAQAAQAQPTPFPGSPPQDSSTQTEPECWTSHTKTRFSIRPSLLSPLYSAYRKDLDRHDRRQLISRLLVAHMMLARELEGFDVNQVLGMARDHASSMQHLSSDLEALAPQSSVGSCTNKATMLGFYSLLEQQLDSSSSSGASKQGGFSSVFQAWNEDFVSKYRHSPSLEPLEAIYAKKDVLSNLRQLGSPNKDAQQGVLPGLGGKGARQQHGAHVTLEGVACAEGKRKTSRAEVRMRHGRPGNRKGMCVTVNGMPYDQYFQGPELRQLLLAPMLMASDTLQQFSVDVVVKGGGISSQAQAARTGIARALQLFVRHAMQREVQPASEARSLGWLRKLARWDKRSVERKKPCREKARKGFAWVKR